MRCELVKYGKVRCSHLLLWFSSGGFNFSFFNRYFVIKIVNTSPFALIKRF